MILLVMMEGSMCIGLFVVNGIVFLEILIEFMIVVVLFVFCFCLVNFFLNRNVVSVMLRGGV